MRTEPCHHPQLIQARHAMPSRDQAVEGSGLDVVRGQHPMASQQAEHVTIPASNAGQENTQSGGLCGGDVASGTTHCWVFTSRRSPVAASTTPGCTRTHQETRTRSPRKMRAVTPLAGRTPPPAAGSAEHAHPMRTPPRSRVHGVTTLFIDMLSIYTAHSHNVEQQLPPQSAPHHGGICALAEQRQRGSIHGYTPGSKRPKSYLEVRCILL